MIDCEGLCGAKLVLRYDNGDLKELELDFRQVLMIEEMLLENEYCPMLQSLVDKNLLFDLDNDEIKLLNVAVKQFNDAVDYNETKIRYTTDLLEKNLPKANNKVSYLKTTLRQQKDQYQEWKKKKARISDL